MKGKSETHIHFVGIGGIGMSGIAEVLFNQGYRVSGSDLSDTDTTQRLKTLGLRVSLGHRAENVENADVVVISSAVKESNPEVVEARKHMIPVIPRAEILGELMRGKIGIAVAGTHGKTTTTSMLATILTVAGKDPTIVIGGKVDALGGNAKLGKGQILVAEADESDGSFLHLPATYAIVTNIDSDHLDHFKTYAEIEKAFIKLIAKIPFYGLGAVCGEDAGVRACASRWTKPVMTYGLSDEFDVYADKIEVDGMGSAFDVHFRSKGAKKHERLGRVQIGIPGRHNVLNSLGTIIVARQLGVSFDQIAEGLRSFRGVKRRFEICWKNSDSTRIVVDDYGHHPTEIRATINAARNFWKGRVISVFQPHRYSRTLNCKEDFLNCFEKSDVVLLTDIYPAGEEPIPGIDSEALVEEMRERAGSKQEIRYIGSVDHAHSIVQELIRDGDLVLCLGAGSISKVSGQLSRILK